MNRIVEYNDDQYEHLPEAAEA